MKKLFALLAVVLAVVSCQKDVDNLDVNMGGDVATISVTLPEDAITRAVGGTDSSLGGLANTAGETIRVILKIYDEEGNPSDQRQVNYLTEDNLTTNFDVRLIPDREYTFVAWADKVDSAADVDKFYNTEDLKNVTLIANTWEAMNEGRDAFTATHTESNFTSVSNITLELKRPLAKLRVVTTDMEALRYWETEPTTATVSYTTPHYTGFNAYEGKAIDRSNDNVEHQNYTIHTYTNEDGKNVKTLFTDYFFAAEGQETIQFNIAVSDQNSRLIREVAFNTEIPVKRNNLTTIQGNILTDGDKINVVIMPEFDNGSNWNPEDDNKDIKAISSNAEFAAAMTGDSGKYIVVSDNIVISASAQTLAATRADEGSNGSNGKVISIDLNGKTIIVENNDTTNALFTLGNNDALIFSGEGTIEGGKLVDGGTVVVTGSAEVEDTVADVKTGVEALEYILANGGEFTMTEDLEATDALLASATKPVILNGNNKTISTSANRIVRITNSNADVTINDVNFVSSAVMVYPSDVRGVAIDANLSNVALTLNNCTIDFTDKTTNDWTYAVNIAGNGTGHKVTVNGGTYEGANVINAHGAKNTIVVKNATLTSLYPKVDVYYGAGIWVLQNQESSVYAEGNTFNGDNAIAFNLGTGTALEEKNNTDNTKLVAAKVNGAYYYNIAEAINAAEDGATIKVLHSHDCNVGATVPTGKTLTLDLNGKTVEGTDTITGSFGLITNRGNLTVTGNGKITLVAKNNRGWNAYSSVISNTVGGKLVVENGTIEHLGGTDMAYGIDNLTNGKGTYAETVINGGNIKSTYRAIRMFLNGIEADNILTVNGGTIDGANKSIWMQDPSANANTGTLVVNEGATLNGDVYLFVTAGSTEWPVEVSIAASVVNGEVLTGNVPAGYEVVEKDGVWTVVAYTKVSTVEELTAALKACQPIILGADITVTEKWDNRFTGAKTSKPITIDGNGKTLKFACEVSDGGNYHSAFRFEAPAVVKNLTIDMSELPQTGSTRVRTMSAKSNLVVDNCKFIGSTIYTNSRAISFGEGAGAAISSLEVSISGSEFVNWTKGISDNENGQDAKSVTITDNTCTNAHVYVSAHDSIVFTGNTLVNSAANFRSYTSAEDATVVATDNTLDANMAQYNIIRGFAAANIDCQEGFTIVE